MAVLGFSGLSLGEKKKLLLRIIPNFQYYHHLKKVVGFFYQVICLCRKSYSDVQVALTAHHLSPSFGGWGGVGNQVVGSAAL